MKLWDRGLEATVQAGYRFALRLIRPDDFWMRTGAGLIVDDELWRHTKQQFRIDNDKPPHPDRLAKILFRSAYHNLE